eukprot:Amastigsp_a448_68.p1 type:complete len:425 gc:universal Amastigsp_a448_68:1323-49(-)
MSKSSSKGSPRHETPIKSGRLGDIPYVLFSLAVVGVAAFVAHQQGKTAFLWPAAASDPTNQPAATLSAPLRLVLWANGGNNTADGADAISVTVASWVELNKAVTAAFAALRPTQKLRPRERLLAFTADGRVLSSLGGVTDGDSIIIVPSHEYFIWPGWQIGHRVAVHGMVNARGAPLVLETASLRPRAFVAYDVISDAETDYIVATGEKTMYRSKTYVPDGSGGHVDEATDDRTSSQTWLDANNVDPKLQALYARVGGMVRAPFSLSGGLQVIRYYPGQHYHAHYDYFPPENYASEPDYFHGRNRFITVLMYLNDVEEGGETVFPRAGDTGYGDHGVITNWGDCSRGIKVRPRRGMALIFYNLLANGHIEGALDPMSLHGGCDVIKGKKFACNGWLYNKNFGEGPNDNTGYMSESGAKLLKTLA